MYNIFLFVISDEFPAVVIHISIIYHIHIAFNIKWIIILFWQFHMCACKVYYSCQRWKIFYVSNLLHTFLMEYVEGLTLHMNHHILLALPCLILITKEDCVRIIYNKMYNIISIVLHKVKVGFSALDFDVKLPAERLSLWWFLDASVSSFQWE